MLVLSAVPVALQGEMVTSAVADSEPVLHAIDIILRGYTVGLPP